MSAGSPDGGANSDRIVPRTYSSSGTRTGALSAETFTRTNRGTLAAGTRSGSGLISPPHPLSSASAISVRAHPRYFIPGIIGGRGC